MSGTLGGGVSTPGTADTSFIFAPERSQQAQNPLAMQNQLLDTVGKVNQLKMFPGQLQLQGQQINANALQLANAHNQAAAAYMAPFLALPPEQQTRARFTDMAARGENAGIAMGGLLNSVAGIDAPDSGFGSAVAPFILSHSQPTEKATGAILPAQTQVDRGLTLQPYLRPAPGMPGQGQLQPVGPGVPLAAGPGTQGQQVTWKDQTGVEHFGTWAQYNIERGNGRVVGDAVPVPGSRPATAPGGGASLPTAFPPALLGPNAPKSGNVPLPSPAVQPPPPIDNGGYLPGGGPGLTDTRGPAPATVTSQENSGKIYDAAVANDTSYNQRKQTLQEGLHAIQNAGGTGPGTEATNHIISFLKANAPALVPKSTGDAVTQYDLAVKNLAAWAASQPGAQRSDMGQQLVQTANATTHIDNGAAQHVLRVAMGLQDYDHQALTQFNKTQGGAMNSGQYGTWLNQNFTPNNHPLGFVFNSLPPKDQQAYINQFKGDRATLQRILNSKNAAEAQ